MRYFSDLKNDSTHKTVTQKTNWKCSVSESKQTSPTAKLRSQFTMFEFNQINFWFTTDATLELLRRIAASSQINWAFSFQHTALFLPFYFSHHFNVALLLFSSLISVSSYPARSTWFCHQWTLHYQSHSELCPLLTQTHCNGQRSFCCFTYREQSVWFLSQNKLRN